MFLLAQISLRIFGHTLTVTSPEMGLAQEQHQGSRLADSAADGEGQFVAQNRLVIRVAEEIHLVRQPELLLQTFRR